MSTDGIHATSVPFVKAGVLSSIDREQIVLDGHNNPGFSGGPAVFRNQKNGQFHVCGVVTSYPFWYEPVYKLAGDTYRETNLFVKNNPGLVNVSPIGTAIEIIENNPIGFNLEHNS